MNHVHFLAFENDDMQQKKKKKLQVISFGNTFWNNSNCYSCSKLYFQNDFFFLNELLNSFRVDYLYNKVNPSS